MGNAILPTGKIKKLINVTHSPKTYQEIITASDDTTFASVIVPKVTSAIDSNIKSANIKSGVSILGVAGLLAGIKTSLSVSDCFNNVLKIATPFSTIISSSGVWLIMASARAIVNDLESSEYEFSVWVLTNGSLSKIYSNYGGGIASSQLAGSYASGTITVSSSFNYGNGRVNIIQIA